MSVGPMGSFEYETQTCGHCNRVYCIKSNDPKATPDLGGHCRICDHSVCGNCADHGGCTPFLKRLEQQEARNRFLQAVSDG